MTYTVVFVREDDGRYSVHVPGLPGCHTWGENLPHAIRMAEDAMQCHLESLHRRGLPLPPDVDAASVELDDAGEAHVYKVSVLEAAQVA
jgi:predicted RNase H-like HicB family nuclease